MADLEFLPEAALKAFDATLRSSNRWFAAGGLTPRLWTIFPLAAAGASVALLKQLPGDRRAWQETQNKLAAFTRFRYADYWWEGDLAASVDRVSSLEPWARLWTLEGLGWVLGERAAPRRERRPLLETGGASDAASLCLHPGLGLFLAARHLAEDGPLPRRMEQLLGVSRDQAQSGWSPVLFEALGLVCLTLFPDDIARVDRELRRLDADLLPYFWHGVGRGDYLIEVRAAESRGLSVRRSAPGQAPLDLARLNRLSGHAWALTLVNLRHPEIVESAMPGPELGAAELEAWSNGVSSAVLLWSGVIGHDQWMGAFLNGSASPGWRTWVLEPCVEALRDRKPGPGIFRYDP